MMATKPKTAQKAIVPVGGKSFPSVRKARAALMARADELVNKFLIIIDSATAAGDYETAAKAMQWLLEHMPEEDGQRIVEISIDKPKQDGSNKPAGPAIQVGIMLGGVNQPKQLPEVIVIDHTPTDTTTEG